MDTYNADREFDVREYLRVLTRRKWTLLGTIVATVALALTYSFAQTPVYTAKADVLVPQQSAIAQASGQNTQLNPAYLQRNIDNAQRFAASDVVKAAARKKLGYAASASVSASADADVLTFHATSTRRARASTVADAYALAYIEADQQRQITAYVSQANVVGKQIEDLQNQQADMKAGTPEFTRVANLIVSLQQTQSTLQAASQLSSGSAGAALINQAKMPVYPSSPKKTENALIGLAIGLLLGVGLAFLVDRLDDSIKSKHDIDEISNGIPLVGLIPEVPGWRDRDDAHVITLESPQSVPAEAYRTLRTSVQFLGIEQPLTVVGVTSPNQGEGKTTTLANLAVSAAKAGLRVVIVCCDLRRPRIHTFFGQSNEIGLTSVLLGEASLDDAVQDIDEQPRLRLLASGPIPPNPAELLNVSRVEQVLQSLARTSDLVLIDCPPVIPVTDSLLISRMVDGMLVVGHARRTHKRELQRALELFGQIDGRVVGTILNAVPSRGGYGYGYGYGSSYTYGIDADEGRRARRRARRQAFERVVDETAREDVPIDLH
jgi:capsular exopolysaccharide synthesis family protein